MRNPFVACFGLLTLIGATALVACATSEAPNIGDIIAARNATDPADAGDGTDTVITEPDPVKPTKPVAPPPVVFDAGGSQDSGVDAGDDDDDNGGQNCDPNNEQYGLEAIMATAQGGGTACPNGGGDCSSDQCCYVNVIMASASVCVAK